MKTLSGNKEVAETNPTTFPKRPERAAKTKAKEAMITQIPHKPKKTIDSESMDFEDAQNEFKEEEPLKEDENEKEEDDTEDNDVFNTTILGHSDIEEESDADNSSETQSNVSDKAFQTAIKNDISLMKSQITVELTKNNELIENRLLQLEKMFSQFLQFSNKHQSNNSNSSVEIPDIESYIDTKLKTEHHKDSEIEDKLSNRSHNRNRGSNTKRRRNRTHKSIGSDTDKHIGSKKSEVSHKLVWCRPSHTSKMSALPLPNPPTTTKRLRSDKSVFRVP